MENGLVIGLLKFALIGKGKPPIDNPKWDEVEEALIFLNQADAGGYISLRDKDDTMSMIIFGELGMFHIGIVTEDDEDYVYCNGSNPVDILEVSIGGNYFKKHQVCQDLESLKKIVKYFYETGLRMEGVIWES